MVNRTKLQTSLKKSYDRILFAKEVLNPVFGPCFELYSSAVPASVQPNQSEQTVIQSVSIYGAIHLEDGTEITCYEIMLQPSVRIEQNKVAIQRYVRKLLTAGQIALVNFIAPQNKQVWRLTLVAKDSELTDQGIKEKTTHAKRYTYLLGPSETCKTPAERFETLSTEKKITFQALVNAFSVEKLSKTFFDEYTLHYQKFCDYLQDSNFRKSVFNISFPDNAPQEEKDKACKPIRDFVKKLLGRIVFLYFVQKKGWLGASDTHYKDGMPDFIKQLFKQSGGNDAFYSTWLSVLFFETLNQKRDHDDFKMPDGKKVKVPFLNGGLFDKEEYDEAVLTLPAKLFHNPDFEDMPFTDENKDPARGFLDFLDAYNFTVHEDSPDDHTVAVDPEMLGHIFENLLEDNKEKGAFYTPKEIVHYMCQESLTEYLNTHCLNDRLQGLEDYTDEQIRNIISHLVKHKEIYPELVKFTSAKSENQLNRWFRQLDALLDTVKICDPAIGSGAFPMGLLQEIYAIKEVIAYELQKPWNPAEVKENIIQNSIYGVDIEKGAVDIARLRFWLSLVVDEEKPRALPNLDYKIVVGDSLVSKFEGEVINIDWEIKEGTQGHLFGNENLFKRQELLKKITVKQQEYFHTNNKQLLATEIRNLKIDILINQLELMIKTKGFEDKPTESGKKTKEQMELYLQTQGWKNTIAKLRKLKQNPQAPFEHFDWKLDFPEVLNPYLTNGNAGFDIVIGNPPYLNVEKIDKFIKSNISKFRTAYQKYDLYVLFYEKGIDLLNWDGQLIYISSNKFLSQGYGLLLRKEILKYHIKQIINFNYDIFESATVRTCIFHFQKTYFSNKNVKIIDIKSQKDIEKFKKQLFNYLDQNIFKETEENNFRINLTNQKIKILKKIKESKINLENICSVNYGLRPIPIDLNLDKGIFIKKNFENGYKLYFEGKNMGYWTVKDYIYIDYKPNIMYNPMFPELFENPKLAGLCTLSDIGKLRFVFDNYNAYTNHSVVILTLWYFFENVENQTVKRNISSEKIIKSKEFNYFYLQGILNSKLIKFYVNELLYDGTHFYPNHMKSLPIKDVTIELQSPLIKLVEKVHNKLKTDISANISDLENQIDQLVYKLYNLTYEEVKVIDPDFELSEAEYESLSLK